MTNVTEAEENFMIRKQCHSLFNAFYWMTNDDDATAAANAPMPDYLFAQFGVCKRIDVMAYDYNARVMGCLSVYLIQNKPIEHSSNSL